MATSPAFYSSILNFPNSKISNPDLGSRRISFFARKRQSFPHFSFVNPISIGDSCPSSSGSCNSATIANSLTLDHDSINDEEQKKAESKIGSKVRVKGPLVVYHVVKLPEFDLAGKVGVLKDYLSVYKGKKISANMPYKVEFVVEDASGGNGKPVKFVAHLKDDEFEFLD